MADADLTAELLRDLLNYNPETGVFTWRKTTSKRFKAGDVAGCDKASGRISIRVAGRLFLAHRLAWLHTKGEWPIGVIDHRDGNALNNRLDNLRDVSFLVNMQNQRRASKRSVSGFLGVCTTKYGRFVAQINVSKKSVYLGTFDTAELAHEAYLNAKRKLHGGCTI